MEHGLLHLQHLSPQDHLMVTSGFFGAGGSGAAHFLSSGGGFVAPVVLDDRWWVEDLRQLGGGVNDDGTGDHQPWQCDGGSSGDPPPPPCTSLHGDESPPPGEQGVLEPASEPHPSPETRKRRDRSKTIVSERKRRVRMKEKLYELRSLVPNITKMDKASIIADAVVYVKNLQSYARKLKEEVAALQAQPNSPGLEHEQQQKRHQDDAGRARPGGRRGHGARVAHVGATQVGEGRFLVTVECERRDGVAAHLCAAVESLACFRVESSSLVGRSGLDRVVSTLTLKASDQIGDATTIGEGMVNHWLTAALLWEGFRTRSDGRDLLIHPSVYRPG